MAEKKVEEPINNSTILSSCWRVLKENESYSNMQEHLSIALRNIKKFTKIKFTFRNDDDLLFLKTALCLRRNCSVLDQLKTTICTIIHNINPSEIIFDEYDPGIIHPLVFDNDFTEAVNHFVIPDYPHPNFSDTIQSWWKSGEGTRTERDEKGNVISIRETDTKAKEASKVLSRIGHYVEICCPINFAGQSDMGIIDTLIDLETRKKICVNCSLPSCKPQYEIIVKTVPPNVPSIRNPHLPEHAEFDVILIKHEGKENRRFLMKYTLKEREYI